MTLQYSPLICLIIFCVIRGTVQSPPRCKIDSSHTEISCSYIARDSDLSSLLAKSASSNETLDKSQVITMEIFGNGQHIPAGILDAYPNLQSVLISSDTRDGKKCTIHAKAFENLRQLYSLQFQNCDLGSNNFASLAPFTEQLKLLTLHDCSVEPYPAVLKQMTNLTQLIISNGNLKAIPTETIKKLAISLKVLVLIGNDLRRVPANTLKGLKSLEKLSLAKNNITEIETGAFDDLVQVNLIHLGKNQIQEFPDGLFNKTLELTYLLYAGNAAFINRNSLAHLTKLQILSPPDDEPDRYGVDNK